VEDLLVTIADQLVLEYTLALMSPETDQEELLSDLLLDVVALLNDFILVLLSDGADTLEDSAELTNIERVVEFGRGRKKSVLDSGPKSNGSVDERGAHANNLRGVSLRVEKLLEDLTINVLNGFLRRKGHVHVEELTLQTVRNVVTTTTWVIHGTEVLKSLNSSVVATIVLG
jgi:hypothetical protein